MATSQDVQPAALEHDGARRPALEVRLDIPKGAAKEQFKEFMDERYDAHVSGLGSFQNKDLVSVDEATIPVVYEKQMDLFAYFEDQADGFVSMRLVGRDSAHNYFGPAFAPEVQQRFVYLLSQYRLFALNAYYNSLLEDQKDRRSDLVRDQERATRAIAKNADRIEENLRDNEKMKKENEELGTEIRERTGRLERLKKDILSTKEGLPDTK